MFWFSSAKKEVKKLEGDVKNSFDSVKQDFKKVGAWIKHIDGKHTEHRADISAIKEHLQHLQADLDEMRELVSFFGPKNKQAFKQDQTAVDKQLAVVGVQTAVQTAVQTGILDNLTVMERGILWALINHNEANGMNLSYADLSALLGKKESTIRGQINLLKRKSEGLIGELREPNGKKMLYVPEKVRRIILKSVKVRVRKAGKTVKNDEN